MSCYPYKLHVYLDTYVATINFCADGSLIVCTRFSPDESSIILSEVEGTFDVKFLQGLSESLDSFGGQILQRFIQNGSILSLQYANHTKLKVHAQCSTS